MRKLQNIKENELQLLWKKQAFVAPLKTQAGDVVSVLDVGELNIEASGPDFKNSRIRIGNLIYIGDIEIDSDYNNWKTHGHNIDAKYNKVILHVSLVNKNNHYYIYTKDGRKVPTITLSRFVKKDFFEKINSELQKKREGRSERLKCYSLADSVEAETKKKFIARLGIERFSKKSERAFERLKELVFIRELGIKEPTIKYSLQEEFQNKNYKSSDFSDKELWQQLFYELLFEALGYTQNKNIMKKLAQAVDIKFIKKNINFIDNIELETLLFNVSGLMPEVKNLPPEIIDEYTLQLAKKWDEISSKYDGKRFDETDWHFFRIRPQNFPTIRIMGGVNYLSLILNKNLIGEIIKKIEEIHNISVLINSIRSLLIIKSRGFWKKHYIFDQSAKNEIRYLVGYSRANEIMINVILPFFFLYFDVFGKENMSRKILRMYNELEQKGDNRIIRNVAQTLKVEHLLNHTVYAQGMIDLYRSYCSKQKCLECEIGKIIFN